MTVIILLVIVGIVVAGGFLIGFIWAVRNGQYDDLYSPSVRILFDEPKQADSISPFPEISEDKYPNNSKLNNLTKSD
ncbi:MAG: cbb3-type cytochrome oxidase assembly protein CcoS [Bacteroidales bacterium]|jgi:cbb3-type cytochrome oxidase maturation protein|nr:cbb3-type cytochrome oxidase assembly protein CcoS [Bacteroidales bacterium]